ncbi:AraC family transcriptional regulator [Rhodococcus zopfii]|uniref:AraC family transcriptional regulator n=1 Tax=Rhodococcus zopfii TaxID=43772 RepID=A0ABU3WS91_9NOCA|nr:AraC family transcriptional regulator [Rhodococcus zopfii]MDV2476864.1 AraC family transcriptional regulator [Rhodococcus zopfii]
MPSDRNPVTYPWTPVDPLGEALHLLRMRGSFYCRSELGAPWGLEMPAFAGSASFHTVVSGEAWLDVPGSAPMLLRPGDFAVVPHGSGHVIRSEPSPVPTVRVDTAPQEMFGDHYSLLRHGGDGDRCTLVCGIVDFDHPTSARLVALLPSILRIEAAAPAPGATAQVLALMADEARRVRPGGEAVLTRLADILVIMAIRSWVESDPAAQRGWVGALQDPQVGRALAAVHRHPERPWTLTTLAREATMSRSAFAARFTSLVGEPAMRYVSRWRMESAAGALRDGATVAELASRSGYESEAGFARAFKRVTGESPGSVRRSG